VQHVFAHALEAGFCVVLEVSERAVSATMRAVSATMRAVSAMMRAVSATMRAVSATMRAVSATEGRRPREVSAKVSAVSGTEGRGLREVSAMAGASRESGSTDMHLPVDPHLDPVSLLSGTESDPKDTPLVPHEQEFVFLSTSRWTDLKRNAVRPEIVSMVPCALNLDLHWFGVTRLKLEGRRILESRTTRKIV
jgi:hypothetical protein